MTARPDVVTDMARHLATDLTLVVQRHMRVMQAGGLSPIDEAIVVAMATDTMLVLAAGMAAILAPAERRRAMIGGVADKFAQDLKHKADTILANVRASEGGTAA